MACTLARAANSSSATGPRPFCAALWSAVRPQISHLPTGSDVDPRLLGLVSGSANFTNGFVQSQSDARFTGCQTHSPNDAGPRWAKPRSHHDPSARDRPAELRPGMSAPFQGSHSEQLAPGRLSEDVSSAGSSKAVIIWV